MEGIEFAQVGCGSDSRRRVEGAGEIQGAEDEVGSPPTDKGATMEPSAAISSLSNATSSRLTRPDTFLASLSFNTPPPLAPDSLPPRPSTPPLLQHIYRSTRATSLKIHPSLPRPASPTSARREQPRGGIALRGKGRGWVSGKQRRKKGEGKEGRGGG